MDTGRAVGPRRCRGGVGVAGGGVRKAANLVEALEQEFPDVRSLFEDWATHIYECVIDLGWNIKIGMPESAGRVQSSGHKDCVFEEVSRLSWRENSDEARAVDAHNIWRRLPRVWRRGIWAVYIEQARGGDTLSRVMGIERREVGGQLRQAYIEIRGQILPAVSRRAA